MCARDEPTAVLKMSAADVLSCRKKLSKTLGEGGIAPPPPDVQGLTVRNRVIIFRYV